MTGQLSPADFNANGGQPQQLTGSAYPTAFSSNLVGGYKHRRTFKRFMRGKRVIKRVLESTSHLHPDYFQE